MATLSIKPGIEIEFENGKPLWILYHPSSYKEFNDIPYTWLRECVQHRLDLCGFKIKVSKPYWDERLNLICSTVKNI